jgi:hypothetical protein
MHLGTYLKKSNAYNNLLHPQSLYSKCVSLPLLYVAETRNISHG